MYFTDRGIEELEDRRGEEQVSVSWLAERLRDFVDLNPGFDVAVDRLASQLASRSTATSKPGLRSTKSRSRPASQATETWSSPRRSSSSSMPRSVKYISFPGGSRSR